MKGSLTPIVSVMLHVIFATFILGLAFSMAESIGPKVRIETTSVMGSRISSGIYMTDAAKEAEVELNLKHEYGFTNENGDFYVNYTSGKVLLAVLGNTGKARINPPVNFRHTETGYAKKVCLDKNPGSPVTVKLGGC